MWGLDLSQPYGTSWPLTGIAFPNSSLLNCVLSQFRSLQPLEIYFSKILFIIILPFTFISPNESFLLKIPLLNSIVIFSCLLGNVADYEDPHCIIVPIILLHSLNYFYIHVLPSALCSQTHSVSVLSSI
jgi:hypothetical protein